MSVEHTLLDSNDNHATTPSAYNHKKDVLLTSLMAGTMSGNVGYGVTCELDVVGANITVTDFADILSEDPCRYSSLSPTQHHFWLDDDVTYTSIENTYITNATHVTCLSPPTARPDDHDVDVAFAIQTNGTTVAVTTATSTPIVSLPAVVSELHSTHHQARSVSTLSAAVLEHQSRLHSTEYNAEGDGGGPSLEMTSDTSVTLIRATSTAVIDPANTGPQDGVAKRTPSPPWPEINDGTGASSHSSKLISTDAAGDSTTVITTCVATSTSDFDMERPLLFKRSAQVNGKNLTVLRDLIKSGSRRGSISSSSTDDDDVNTDNQDEAEEDRDNDSRRPLTTKLTVLECPRTPGRVDVEEGDASEGEGGGGGSGGQCSGKVVECTGRSGEKIDDINEDHHRRHQPACPSSDGSILTNSRDPRRSSGSSFSSRSSGQSNSSGSSAGLSSDQTSTDSDTDDGTVEQPPPKRMCLKRVAKDDDKFMNVKSYAVILHNNVSSDSIPNPVQINKTKNKLKTQLARIKVDKLKRVRVRIDRGTVAFPTVCSSKTIGEGSTIDNEDAVIYPDTFNVMSIREMIANYLPSTDPNTIVMAKSTFGEILRRYALAKTSDRDLDDVHFTTNYIRDLKVYHLVYGAVPKQYALPALHILRFILENTKDRSFKGAGKKYRKNKTAVMSEGELEILVYIYWQLSTQDLLGWKNDLPRRAQKMILTICWWNLKEEIERRSQTKVASVNLVAAKEVLNAIQRYAAFDDPIHLSAACIHVARDGLAKFWPLINDEHRNMWQFLFKSAGVHHYLCCHTLKVMHRKLVDVIHNLQLRLGEGTTYDGATVKSLLFSVTARDPTINSGSKSVLTTSLIQSLFPQYINHSKEVSKDLVVSMDNLLFSLCRSCAAHFTMNGLYEYDVIGETQMAGFVLSNLDYKNVNLSIPIIGDEKLERSLQKLLLTMMKAMLPDKGLITCDRKRRTKRTKLTTKAVRCFLAYFRFVISSSLSGLMDSFESTAFSGRIWSDKFKDAVDDYMSAHCVNTRNVDAWQLTNEPNVEVHVDGGTSLLVTFDDLYEADSQDERDDVKYDGSSTSTSDDEEYVEEAAAELRDLARPYPELRPADFPVIRWRMSKKQATMKRRCEDATVTPNTSGRPFDLSVVNKIRRCLCVLCALSNTSRLMDVTPDCTVACCALCVQALNEHTNPESLRVWIRDRVEARHKPPVLFHVIDERRLVIDIMPPIVCWRDMACGTYNRKHPNFGKKLATGLAKRNRTKRK